MDNQGQGIVPAGSASFRDDEPGSCPHEQAAQQGGDQGLPRKGGQQRAGEFPKPIEQGIAAGGEHGVL